MNAQNLTVWQMSVLPAQFPLIGATSSFIQAQEASGVYWPHFLPQWDCEILIDSFLQSLRQQAEFPAKQRLTPYFIEQQCYKAARSLRAYNALCHQKLVQITSCQQQNLLNPYYQISFFIRPVSTYRHKNFTRFSKLLCWIMATKKRCNLSSFPKSNFHAPNEQRIKGRIIPNPLKYAYSAASAFFA